MGKGEKGGNQGTEGLEVRGVFNTVSGWWLMWWGEITEPALPLLSLPPAQHWHCCPVQDQERCCIPRDARKLSERHQSVQNMGCGVKGSTVGGGGRLSPTVPMLPSCPAALPRSHASNTVCMSTGPGFGRADGQV